MDVDGSKEAAGAAAPEPVIIGGPAAQPPARWANPSFDLGGLSVGGILRDTFARYAADPVRIFLAGVLPSVLALFATDSPGLTLLAGVLGLLATATVTVLGDRGRSVPLGSALSLSFRRVGWLWLAGFAISIFVGILAIVLLVVLQLVAGRNPALIVVMAGLAAIPLLWVFARLALALPAVVIDDVSANKAFDRARAATKRRSAAARVGAVLIIAGLASAPVGLGAGALIAFDVMPDGIARLLGGLLSAVVAPIYPLALLAAYRRVHPRYEARRETWAAASPLTGPPYDPSDEVPALAPTAATVPDPARLPIPAPPFGGLARALAGASLALSVGGVIVFGSVLGAAATGSPGELAGSVPRGTFAFGASADLRTCSVGEQFTELRSGGPIAYIASFRQQTTTSDRIRLVVTYDGVEIVNETQAPGVFDCLGSPTPETGLPAGRYEFMLYVNDEVSAAGGITAR